MVRDIGVTQLVECLSKSWVQSPKQNENEYGMDTFNSSTWEVEVEDQKFKFTLSYTASLRAAGAMGNPVSIYIWAWCHTPLIPAIERRRQQISVSWKPV